MRVQSMPARSADSCAAFIRITPATMGGHLKPLPSSRFQHITRPLPSQTTIFTRWRALHGRPPPPLHRVTAQRLLRQERQTIRTLPEVYRLGRNVNREARRWCQHERVRRSAMNNSLSTARPGVPRTSTRAPWNSTVTTAATSDTEGSAAAGRDDSDTTGTSATVCPRRRQHQLT